MKRARPHGPGAHATVHVGNYLDTQPATLRYESRTAAGAAVQPLTDVAVPAVAPSTRADISITARVDSTVPVGTYRLHHDPLRGTVLAQRDLPGPTALNFDIVGPAIPTPTADRT